MDAMQSNYAGFAQQVGFGSNAAIIVVDFITGFTSEQSLLGSNYEQQLQHTLALLTEARQQKLPIIFTTVSYETEQEAKFFIQKVPALKLLLRNSEWTEVDPILKRRDEELLIVKKFASAFYGTTLQSFLTSLQVDTLILTGCTTSGCVRATAVDGLQNGYRVIVPKQCVGDRSKIQHEANLYDIENKYGDVVEVQAVFDYFHKLKEANSNVQSSY
jgi:maleamate amidohydrolase